MILSRVKNTFNKYRGLSTEEKPTNIPQHSSFLETDTGVIYNYDGSQWNPEKSDDGDGGSGSGGVLYLTTTINEDKKTVLVKEDGTGVVSVSYNDVLAAVNQNKVVILKERWENGAEFILLGAIEYITSPGTEYDVIFLAKYFIAKSPTEPLVLYDKGDDGGDKES